MLCAYNELYDNGFTGTTITFTKGDPALVVSFPINLDYYGELFNDRHYCGTQSFIFYLNSDNTQVTWMTSSYNIANDNIDVTIDPPSSITGVRYMYLQAYLSGIIFDQPWSVDV